MSEPTLTLSAASLLSKWGFNDGNTPDEIWDALDERGIDTPWHPVLIALVRTHLLPALHQMVEVEELDTCHNPIRATTVNGEDVERCWYAGQVPDDLLTPASVTVPFAAVLQAVQQVTEGQ